MKQLPLLAIRKRKTTDPPISSRVILAFVRERLSGYAQRQAGRVELRKAKQNKENRAEQKVSMPTLFDMEPEQEVQP